MGQLGASDLAEEILELVVRAGRIEIGEIKNKLCLTSETTDKIVQFLEEFGFVQFDEIRRYVRPSKACKEFFEETAFYANIDTMTV